jgi:uncharacterized protein involved in outer membrane biogenesis
MARRCAKPGCLATGTGTLYREARGEGNLAGMKRVLGIIAAVVLAAVALVSLFVALLPREAVKTQIGQQIASWTGREVSIRGEPEISLFPTLSVTLNDVQVSGPPDMRDARIISMDRLTGTISLAPLLIGRVEIKSFSMVRPVVRLIRDEQGHRNWIFETSAAALQLAFAGDVPLGAFALEGGSVIYEDRLSGEAERLDSVNLSLEWTSVRTPLAIEGSGIWRGEQVSFEANAGAPFAFINGASTPLEARITSAPIAMIFAGSAGDYPAPQLSGDLKLTTASLRRFAEWLGTPIGSGSTPGRASLFGKAELRDGVLSVADAQLTLDGNSASGALNVTARGTPDVTGTLAFESLDLTPYFSGLATALATASDWRKVELPTGWLRDMSADVRLSAGSVKIGAVTAGATAASASLKEGRLEVGVARTDLEGGSLSGNLTIVDRNVPSVEAQLRAIDIDLATMSSAFDLPHDLAGTGAATIDVATTGRDLGALLDAVNGTMRIDVRDGAVPVFGLASVAAEAGFVADPGPLSPLGPVQVNAAAAGFSLSSGVAVLERSRLTTPSYSADVQGWIGMRDGTLGLNGTMWEAAAAVPPENGSYPFAIEGTLAHPEPRPLALAN